MVLAGGGLTSRSLPHLTSGGRSATGAEAAVPAGWPRVAYFRLHGSPRKYWSRYEEDDIATLATGARSIPSAEEVWCVFDNTASGAAIENAWECVNV